MFAVKPFPRYYLGNGSLELYNLNFLDYSQMLNFIMWPRTIFISLPFISFNQLPTGKKDTKFMCNFEYINSLNTLTFDMIVAFIYTFSLSLSLFLFKRIIIYMWSFTRPLSILKLKP